METSDAIAQYARREQELLRHLREAQIAATVGDLPGVLDAQTKIYAILTLIAGEQTQQVLRAVYGLPHG